MMANEDTTKPSTNLKVPPLKIVLNSHQNNTVVSKIAGEDNQSRSDAKLECSNDHFVREGAGRRSSLESKDISVKSHKRGTKSLSDRCDPDSGQTSIKFAALSTTSSSDSSLDRSSSTSPSSESESLASNSTIISEIQVVKSKTETRDESVPSKPERASRYSVKGSSSERLNTVRDQTGESVASGSRELNLNANQRITRSSQRAAQQVRFENHDLNGEDTGINDMQDKVHETARKVKRRRNEPQESEQDLNRSATQPVVNMSIIYPADYQLPSQNSFELYRDIRKRPYKKLLKLNLSQPRIPYGYRDYLLNGGPYLLDGNKLGVGLNGSKIETSSKAVRANGHPLIRAKISSSHQKQSKHLPSIQRHTSYVVPKPCQPPRSLVVDTPLYDLFLDQEKSRHQLRIQHLKERERFILASEQEILRVYNKAAIADMQQKFHLSACTYLYHQERYHYLEDKTKQCKKFNSSHIDNQVSDDKLSTDSVDKQLNTSDFLLIERKSNEVISSDKKPIDLNERVTKDSEIISEIKNGHDKSSTSMHDVVKASSNSANLTDTKQPPDDTLKGNEITNANLVDSNQDASLAPVDSSKSQPTTAKDVQNHKSQDEARLNSNDTASRPLLTVQCETPLPLTEEGLKSINEEEFLNQLQEIDDKWDKIKREMLKRHRNESDSLHAVQNLEWEWKAKEIGACDVRVSLKVAPELVPKVQIEELDY